ncbi:MAG: hypothetical protein NC827_00765 [Candidatus Omnitrophica bacterium]|nr:hypothetical protein [Candidatus Omnitrophota bacterium]MCM8801833.1 hypothetical protein [Candidatus Omnitrophota bacterium]
MKKEDWKKKKFLYRKINEATGLTISLPATGAIEKVSFSFILSCMSYLPSC